MVAATLGEELSVQPGQAQLRRSSAQSTESEGKYANLKIKNTTKKNKMQTTPQKPPKQAKSDIVCISGFLFRLGHH